MSERGIGREGDGRVGLGGEFIVLYAVLYIGIRLVCDLLMI